MAPFQYLKRLNEIDLGVKMGGFKERGFDTTTYIEGSIEEKKLVLIACEGAETEYQYFNVIKDKLTLKQLVHVELIERDDENKNSSAPTKVVESIQHFIDNGKLETVKSNNHFDEGFDIFWIVVDRETQPNKKVNLQQAISICKEKEYCVALTNPSFEFWLLLHFDISQYDKKYLFENKKVTKKKRFLEKELSRLVGGYNKSNIKEEFVTEENIKRALGQEKFFENDLEKIIDNLGSNVGNLINEILEL